MGDFLFGRYTPWGVSILFFIGSGAGSYFSHLFFLPTALFFCLSFLGLIDFLNKDHPVLGNYPLVGRMRYLLESIRPELRQYFFESDSDELPFSRNQRAMVYQRAKNSQAKKSFGTELNLYDESYAWVNHSIATTKIEDKNFRINVGAETDKNYAMSLLNISGMSFGALSPPAIHALNAGAKIGGFAHNTGEGSLSKYHQAGGGDIIWQISTGYFGCRKHDGSFDPSLFEEKATSDQVKMIEIKLSQGAKPGHGGVLPGPKVNKEIAETRGVPAGLTCESPSSHSEFSSPRELLRFAQQLKSLSGGKPVGIKLCIGHPWEFVAIVKAMVETGQNFDFITVDGSEGGTGAAPTEFSDNIGSPLRDALVFVDNALIGAGLRDRVKVGASGKIISSYDILRICALGADWVNMARPFMFSLGCIQAKDCGSGLCPTGITTQDPNRYRVLDIPSRANRVANFHRHSIEAVAELMESVGVHHPSELNRRHIVRRLSASEIKLADQIYPKVSANALITGEGRMDDPRLSVYWPLVAADSFGLSEEIKAELNS